jgi:hypothetical protein
VLASALLSTDLLLVLPFTSLIDSLTSLSFLSSDFGFSSSLSFASSLLSFLGDLAAVALRSILGVGLPVLTISKSSSKSISSPTERAESSTNKTFCLQIQHQYIHVSFK